MEAVPKHWYLLTLHSIITWKVKIWNFSGVVKAVKLMPEKKVQNLNPIEKLLTENLFDHIYAIHERYKLIEICPFYLFVFTIYSSLMYVKYSMLQY